MWKIAIAVLLVPLSFYGARFWFQWLARWRKLSGVHEVENFMAGCAKHEACVRELRLLPHDPPSVERVFQIVDQMWKKCDEIQKACWKHGMLKCSRARAKPDNPLTACLEKYMRFALQQIVIWKKADDALFNGTSLGIEDEVAVWVIPAQTIIDNFWERKQWRAKARSLIPELLRYQSRFTGKYWCQKEASWRALFYDESRKAGDIDCVRMLQELFFMQAKDKLFNEQSAAFNEFRNKPWVLPWQDVSTCSVQHPSLTQQPFWETSDSRLHSWVQLFEKSFHQIRKEFLDAYKARGWNGLASYGGSIGTVQNGTTRGGWEKMALYAAGEGWNPKTCSMIPTACTILRGRIELDQDIAGRLRIDGKKPKAPPILVNIYGLAPRAELRLHAGHSLRLVTTLGLQVPEGCCPLTVGGQTRYWQEGKVLTFDDAFPHELQNKADEWRFVLSAMSWHPDLIIQLNYHQ